MPRTGAVDDGRDTDGFDRNLNGSRGGEWIYALRRVSSRDKRNRDGIRFEFRVGLNRRTRGSCFFSQVLRVGEW